MTTPDAAADRPELAAGDEVEMEIGPVGHGGVCVARVEGRVVFVRYALPGERALVRITEARTGSYCRGEAVRIVRADPRRVDPPCSHFGPGGCGGCDFQHADIELQRELKASVVAEQLRRLAGIDWPVTVEALPSPPLGWRTRVRWAVGEGSSDDEVLGPRRFRSHDVVPVSAERPCVIADDGLSAAAAHSRAPSGADEVVLVHHDGAAPIVAWQRRGKPVPMRGPARSDRKRRTGRAARAGDDAIIVEIVAGREFAVRATGFWQAHRDAPEVLSAAVREALSGIDLIGAQTWDLYGGVGLFAAVLADLVGPQGSVVTVESDPTASRLAGRNLRDVLTVRAVSARVERALAEIPGSVDAIVLDPPRSGAGRAVVQSLAGRAPHAVVYVACDPAALARDAATFGQSGYRLAALRAFDAFPQTHHVECVATFLPTA